MSLFSGVDRNVFRPFEKKFPEVLLFSKFYSKCAEEILERRFSLKIFYNFTVKSGLRERRFPEKADNACELSRVNF